MAVSGDVTPSQLLFCVALVRDPSFSVSTAARAVGIHLSVAEEWVKDPAVSKKVDELIRERCERMLIDADIVLAELLKNARLARHKGAFRESNEALLMLGKHFGLRLDGSAPVLGGSSVSFKPAVSGGKPSVEGKRDVATLESGLKLERPAKP